jgi:hypothetical protein
MEKRTSIQISNKLAKKLRIQKAMLGVDTIEEVLEAYLNIPTADNLQIKTTDTPLKLGGKNTA